MSSKLDGTCLGHTVVLSAVELGEIVVNQINSLQFFSIVSARKKITAKISTFVKAMSKVKDNPVPYGYQLYMISRQHFIETQDTLYIFNFTRSLKDALQSASSSRIPQVVKVENPSNKEGNHF